MPQIFRFGAYTVYFWSNNNSHIPQSKLKLLMRMIEANSNIIMEEGIKFFGSLVYYC